MKRILIAAVICCIIFYGCDKGSSGSENTLPSQDSAGTTSAVESSGGFSEGGTHGDFESSADLEFGPEIPAGRDKEDVKKTSQSNTPAPTVTEKTGDVTTAPNNDTPAPTASEKTGDVTTAPNSDTPAPTATEKTGDVTSAPNSDTPTPATTEKPTEITAAPVQTATDSPTPKSGATASPSGIVQKPTETVVTPKPNVMPDDGKKWSPLVPVN